MAIRPPRMGMSHGTAKNSPLGWLTRNTPSARRQAELEQSRFTKNADWGTNSLGNRSGAGRPPRKGVTSELPANRSTPIASTTRPVAIHHPIPDVTPSTTIMRPHTGNRSETTSRIMKLAVRSALLDPSLAIRIPAALIQQRGLRPAWLLPPIASRYACDQWHLFSGARRVVQMRIGHRLHKVQGQGAAAAEK